MTVKACVLIPLLLMTVKAGAPIPLLHKEAEEACQLNIRLVEKEKENCI